MPLHSSLPPPTKAEQALHDRIREMPCLVTGLHGVEIHHLTSGGRRISHEHVLGLSPWAHRGVCDEGKSVSAMRSLYGPSVADGRGLFQARFGSNVQLLLHQCMRLGSGMPETRRKSKGRTASPAKCLPRRAI